jgi:hypothetical protein
LAEEANWWDNTPEGRELLKKEIEKMEIRMENQQAKEREEERHQDQMKKLQEIEAEIYRLRLNQESSDLQRNFEYYNRRND